MRKKQENLATAHKEAIGFLEANDALLTVIPNYMAAVAAYKNMFGELQSQIDTQQTNIKAYVLNKELKRKALMDVMLDESSKLGFLAFDQNDEPLKMRTKLNLSGLQRKRDTMLISAARILLAEVNANLTALAPYGGTAASVANFENALKEYDEVIDVKSVAFGERVSATAKIERQLRAMRPMLSRMKALVRMTRSPEMMERFETAAKVKNLGVRRYNLTGTVMDDEDKLAIHKAQVTVYGQEGKLSTVLTNENGAYRFLSLPTGEYKMVVEKEGFVEHTLTFEILPKNRQAIDVELEFDNSGDDSVNSEQLTVNSNFSEQ